MSNHDWWMGALAVATATVAGAGVGALASGQHPPPLTAAGDNDSATPRCSPSTAPRRTQVRCRTTNTVLVLSGTDQTLRFPETHIRVLSSRAFAASAEEGRRRERMRVTVRLRVINRGSQTRSVSDLVAADAYLSIDGRRVRRDTRSDRRPGALPFTANVAPQQARQGDLAFEIGGRVTRAFLGSRSAELGVRRGASVTAGGLAEIGVIRFDAPRPRPLKPGASTG